MPKKLNAEKNSSPYETKPMLNSYMLMHWGRFEDMFDPIATPFSATLNTVHLPTKCAEIVLRFAKNFRSALDLGCAVGRATFELARSFENVVGIDYSHEFIESAQQLKFAKSATYFRKESGLRQTPLTCHVDPEIPTERIHFAQGDACHLSEEFKNFDAVLFSNVLCRLSEPQLCLSRLQGENGLVKPGGILVMTTPFSWLEQYTPKENWLDGVEEVKKILSEFELIHEEELPFVIRDHQRKFELIITHCSVWRRVGKVAK